jgi:hypothetical protein
LANGKVYLGNSNNMATEVTLSGMSCWQYEIKYIGTSKST